MSDDESRPRFQFPPLPTGNAANSPPARPGQIDVLQSHLRRCGIPPYDVEFHYGKRILDFSQAEARSLLGYVVTLPTARRPPPSLEPFVRAALHHRPIESRNPGNEHHIEVDSDAARINNQGPCGWAVLVRPAGTALSEQSGALLVQGVLPTYDVNVAELHAVLVGARLAVARGATFITSYTDAQAVTQAVYANLGPTDPAFVWRVAALRSIPRMSVVWSRRLQRNANRVVHQAASHALLVLARRKIYVRVMTVAQEPTLIIPPGSSDHEIAQMIEAAYGSFIPGVPHLWYRIR